jgi:Fe-S-cluster containining protein
MREGAGHSFENGKSGAGLGKCGGPDLSLTPQEAFVRELYSRVDEAVALGLNRLRSENGIIPTCKPGCCSCCRFHILTNILEAHTLARFVRREFSWDQVNELRFRTQQWWEWDRSRPGRYQPSKIDIKTDLSNYEHCCPLLVDGSCSAYPVRPMACRTHYVDSHQQRCFAANDPKSSKDHPNVISSILEATQSFTLDMRQYIENSGMDYSRSIMLLPHHMAIQMGWDFAVW